MGEAFGSVVRGVTTSRNGDSPAVAGPAAGAARPAAAVAHRVRGRLSSIATVRGTPSHVWRLIVNVDIAQYPQPRFFRLLGIPHPERAEVSYEGVGGERIASFDTGKRFLQRITEWDPPRRYAFTFNPEPGFKVLYFFDLSDGPVQIPAGAYDLTPDSGGTRIVLSTEYSIDRRARLMLQLPVMTMLKLFQRYLLRGIARNAARGLGEV
jgi:hypothetical protein